MCTRGVGRNGTKSGFIFKIYQAKMTNKFSMDTRKEYGQSRHIAAGRKLDKEEKTSPQKSNLQFRHVSNKEIGEYNMALQKNKESVWVRQISVKEGRQERRVFRYFYEMKI